MAERMSIWSGLWQAAYSAPAYRASAAGGTGRMLAYLTLLVLIASAATTARTQVMIGNAVGQFKASRWWEANLPEIRIAGGQASSDVAQPFRKNLGGLVFILDTTGTVTEAEPPDSVLMTKTTLVVRQDRRGQTRVYDLRRMPDVTLNQQNIETWFDGVMRWLWLATLIALFAAYWVVKMLQALFWSLLSLIVNAVSGRRLRYGALLNIGILALTVPWALDLIRMLFPGGGALVQWLPLVVYVGYLVWGILVQPKAAESASSSPEPIHAP